MTQYNIIIILLNIIAFLIGHWIASRPSVVRWNKARWARKDEQKFAAWRAKL